MSLKEEAKQVILDLFGPINAERINSFDDSDPASFLEKVKGIISAMLGDSEAEKSLAHLYTKYKVKH